MFVHHVFFWMNNPDNQQEKLQLKQGLESLLAIDPKVLAHVGTPASTNRPVIDNSYDFSLLLVFSSMEDHDHYQQHPIHLQFVENCSPIWKKVLIYDAD